MVEPYEIEDQLIMNYRYSLGGQSRFFIELKNNRQIFGARCPKCGTVYCPPRVACAKCYQPTEWIPVKDTGVIKVSTLVWYSGSKFIMHVPYAVGYIQLDGASTAICHSIMSENLVPSKIRPSARVRAVFKKKREGKITDFFLVPLDEYQSWIIKPEYEGGKSG